MRIKGLIGNLLIQSLVLSLILLGYLLYRIVAHQDYYLLCFLLIFEIAQIYVPKVPLMIALIQHFEPLSMFQASQIVEEERIKPANAMICVHPHGVFNYSTLLNLYRKDTFFEKIIFLGSRVALNVPFFGMLCRMYGVQSVGAKCMETLLKKGVVIGIAPGGFEEATINTPKENRVYILNRKGFIKYALRHGTTIYPVFNFGENQLFKTMDKFRDFRLWLNRFKLSATIFWSRFGTLPEPNTKLCSVCGRGIELPKIERPTKEDVDKYHSIYVNRLRELYDKYGPLYQPGVELKIF